MKKIAVEFRTWWSCTVAWKNVQIANSWLEARHKSNICNIHHSNTSECYITKGISWVHLFRHRHRRRRDQFQRFNLRKLYHFFRFHILYCVFFVSIHDRKGSGHCVCYPNSVTQLSTVSLDACTMHNLRWC